MKRIMWVCITVLPLLYGGSYALLRFKHHLVRSGQRIHPGAVYYPWFDAAHLPSVADFERDMRYYHAFLNWTFLPCAYLECGVRFGTWLDYDY